MTLFRIYTEDKNRESIHDMFTSAGIEGYTMIPAIGVFKGVGERSLVIEVIGRTPLVAERIASVCIAIKDLNEQEQVLLTTQDIDLRVF